MCIQSSCYYVNLPHVNRLMSARAHREGFGGDRDKTWADTYWQQLQHLSAAATALNQQHMLALSNQNQQMAALAQYQMHVNAAAQLVESAGASLPGLQVRHTP